MESVEVRCNRRFADALYYYCKPIIAYFKEVVNTGSRIETHYWFCVSNQDRITLNKSIAMLDTMIEILNGKHPHDATLDMYLIIAQNLAINTWEVKFVDDIWKRYNLIKNSGRKKAESKKHLQISKKQAIILERITKTKWPGDVYDSAQKELTLEEKVEKYWKEMEEEYGKYISSEYENFMMYDSRLFE